jgi:alkylation response protein AidB-like acyl-CoA dehydrogenase
MDLSLNEGQKMLKNTARRFLEKECPKSLVREVATSDKGYSPQLHLKMAELGWLGMGIPEEYGGIGGDFIDLVILYEEMGRALVPGPHFITSIVCVSAILDAGTEEQKTAMLPRIADGQLLLTLAQYELDGGYGAASITLPAVQEGPDYVLDGVKLFVPFAHVADYFICATRTGKGDLDKDGITLFLVDARTPGISHSPLVTIADDKQSEVVFQNVRVPASNMLGPPGGGWNILQKAVQKGIVMQCAEMVGGAEKAMEMAIDYSKQRIQFGRPIGSFTAIQHSCADMVVYVEGARCITYEAACKICDGDRLAREAHMAKAFAGNAYRLVTSGCHQIFGGVGYMVDHDMHLYYRRAKALELALGDVDYHVRELADRLDSK